MQAAVTAVDRLTEMQCTSNELRARMDDQSGAKAILIPMPLSSQFFSSSVLARRNTLQRLWKTDTSMTETRLPITVSTGRVKALIIPGSRK